MGSIRAGNHGFLFFDFRYRGQRCREATRLPDNATNRKRMQQALDRIEAEITLGTFDYGKYFPESAIAQRFDIGHTVACANAVPNFEQFAWEWLAENKASWKESYRQTIKGTLRLHLVPAFGAILISNINKPQILKFRAQLASAAESKTQQLSNDRINHIMTPLRMIVTEAADRFIFANPWTGIKPLPVRRTHIEPFTLDEVQLILRRVRTDFRSYYAVRFFTGLRTGEVDGLKWKYVDFARREILVRETVVDGREETAKTDGSQRVVAISQIVYDALKTQYAITAHFSEYVFCAREGTPLMHRNITRRVWYPLLRHLKLKTRRPYQTRHTAATLWLAAGENPEWIARQMGHTTTEMLFTVYSRFVPNLTRQDGSAMERLLSSRFNSSQLTQESDNESSRHTDAKTNGHSTEGST